MIINDRYKVPYHREPLNIHVDVPGSKSITNRALLIAAMADGKSVIDKALFSDDSRHFLNCLSELGYKVNIDEESRRVEVYGCYGRIPKESATIYVGSAGTAARFLTAFLALSKGTYTMQSSEQMKKRPMAPLLDSLRSTGCQITYLEEEGHFPFTLTGANELQSHMIDVNIGSSSQFLSALLMTACVTNETIKIRLNGNHAKSYIYITLKVMEQFGIDVTMEDEQTYVIKKGSKYNAISYQVEPDVSAACYFYAAAFLTGGSCLVNDVHFTSMQGDIGFLRILESLGAILTDTPDGIMLEAPNGCNHDGITVDMSSCSDQTMTLSVIAPFLNTSTTITGIGHIRLQESDRISAIVTELTRLGIRCDEGPDYITIYPGDITAATISTYEDHRMAMAFSLIGLKVDGIIIDNPMCCRKTFEDYFDILDTILTK